MRRNFLLILAWSAVAACTVSGIWDKEDDDETAFFSQAGNSTMPQDHNATSEFLTRLYRSSGNEVGVQSGERLLEIPPRKQWMNANGYCGEVSIQQSLLYYAGYASQATIRKLGDGEILFNWNMEDTLRTLKLEFARWDSKQKRKWRNYLTWAKYHIADGHPVIVAIYWREESSRKYDHIVTFLGVRAQSLHRMTYVEGDEMTFVDHFSQRLFHRRFDSLVDDRAMKSSCKGFPYCIPIRRQYGVAVTGITDPNRETYPARLFVDSWDEPNVTKGQDPKLLNGTLLITGLTAGEQYSILRYNDPTKIPERKFLSSAYDERVDFTPTGTSYSFSDTIISNSLAVYRVVKTKATR